MAAHTPQKQSAQNKKTSRISLSLPPRNKKVNFLLSSFLRETRKSTFFSHHFRGKQESPLSSLTIFEGNKKVNFLLSPFLRETRKSTFFLHEIRMDC